MDTVIINPDRVDELAEQLTKHQNDMVAKMDDVDNNVISMRNCWEDAVKVDYDNDFKKLDQEFKEFSEQIPDIAKQYHDHAEQMRRIGGGKIK